MKAPSACVGTRRRRGGGQRRADGVAGAREGTTRTPPRYVVPRSYCEEDERKQSTYRDGNTSDEQYDLSRRQADLLHDRRDHLFLYASPGRSELAHVDRTTPVGVGVREQLGGVAVAVEAGEHQRRVPVVVGKVEVGLGVDEVGHEQAVAAAARERERRLPLEVDVVDGRAEL